jgi:hypothetical protein
MGEYYSSNSPSAFTKKKMEAMGHSSADRNPDGDGDRSKSEQADDYGKPPEPSDSSKFKKGGAVHGKGKKGHLGRMGRATGGRVGRAAGGPVDDENDSAGKKVKGGVVGDVNTNMKTNEGAIRQGDLPKYARGGRASGKGKGKTVVNVVIGGKDDKPPPMAGPPMLPPPPPGPPPPPPHPPMAPPQGGPPPMMPSGGAPMGPAGAPPGGMPPPPMRARGGRVGNLGKFAHPAKAGFSDSKAPHRGGGKEGFSDVKMTGKRAPMADGSCNFKAKRDPNETAGNNGQGRLEKARRQYS